MIVAGIGFRRGCSSEKIVDVLQAALQQAGLPNDALALIAVPEFKAGESGPKQAARSLKLGLSTIGGDAMQAAQANCVTRSETAKRETGFYSVAEGAALAAAGPAGKLILPRIDNGAASCALAEDGAK